MVDITPEFDLNFDIKMLFHCRTTCTSVNCNSLQVDDWQEAVVGVKVHLTSAGSVAIMAMKSMHNNVEFICDQHMWGGGVYNSISSVSTITTTYQENHGMDLEPTACTGTAYLELYYTTD